MGGNQGYSWLFFASVRVAVHLSPPLWMSTPRSKPMAKADAPAAPVAKPAAKPKAKKPKGSAAPTAPIEAPKPVAAESLDEAGSKKELDELQKRYAALVVNFNNQQTELQSCQTQLKRAEDELEVLRSSSAGSGGGGGDEKGLLEKMSADLRAVEAANMALQKKVNKLQVEHVSEEEVDQLFYALEQKEAQLEAALAEKEQLEGEVLTARQMSARGAPVPTIVEIHHHNTLSDDDDDDAEDADGAKADEPKEVS